MTDQVAYIQGLIEELGVFATSKLNIYSWKGGPLLAKCIDVNDMQRKLETMQFIANRPKGDIAAPVVSVKTEEIFTQKFDWKKPLVIDDYTFGTEPYDHQKWIFYLTRDDIFKAIFADMGTGKSKMMIDTASWLYMNRRIDRVLVIAPNSVHTKWIRQEVPIHTPENIPYKSAYWRSQGRVAELKQIALDYDGITEEVVNGIRWFSINIDAVKMPRAFKKAMDFVKGGRCLGILDESTRVKNPKAKRSIKVLELARECEYRRALTGTPISQGLNDLYNQFEFLEPGILGVDSFYAFQSTYEVRVNPAIKRDLADLVCPDPTRPGGPPQAIYDLVINDLYKLRCQRMPRANDVKQVIDGHNMGPFLNPWKIHAKLRETKVFHGSWRNQAALAEKIAKYAIRVKKEDCLDLPPRTFADIPIELAKEQRRVYDTLRDAFLVDINEDRMTAIHHLPQAVRLQEVLGGYYVPDEGTDPKRISDEMIPREAALLELAERIGLCTEEHPDEQLVVWCRFTHEIRHLAKLFAKIYGDESVDVIIGGQNGTVRDSIVDAFQDPSSPLKIVIGNPKAGGIGIDLFAARYAVIYSSDFNYEDHTQALDRIHRIGQTRNTTIYYMKTLGTIDVRIAANLKNKGDVSRAILDDPTAFFSS